MTRMRKIATEEAWSIPEVAAELREVSRGPSQSLDKLLVGGIYDAPADASGYSAMNFLDGLLDIEEKRLPEMDALGVDMHLLSLTAPGVQMFDADTATELAALANDRLAEICRKRPDRFAGLASFAPHSPKRAAREMERAINDLKLNGFILNSHTNGEYLDDPKYWPVLEAAEGLNACIYIHPRAASDTLKGPLQDYGMDSAMWGYGVEVGTHAVRMMAGGVFDSFPNLKICIGHMGEAIPFWIWRINFMNSRAQAIGRARKTKRSMAEYFQSNFVITTSGVEDPLALRYAIDKIGIDNVMWAIDYPYQPQKPAVDFMDAAPVTDAERHALYHGNAERIFHIAPLEN
ncbi:2,3-dihydroxybenzoate decarboxylase/5-carboxyvanillate decarboxylase [Sphingobium xanthum]|jgi:5-carboxyvanillate decarboxylase|uniref:amidohydrolase family protein n=1 Tax=Sphingobium xanthum TaxID=1387165 RepID=UPI001FED1008|nr:amidohydrolase family protein [Sphingobium xanthum]